MTKREKKVLVVSNDAAGIVEVLERNGFKIMGVVIHDDWTKHLGEMEACHMVVLDEVDQFINGNLWLDDEEERILLTDDGPIVLVLARDEDFRLDRRAQCHRRWRVHHKSQVLEPCLQELFLAAPNRKPKVMIM